MSTTTVLSTDELVKLLQMGRIEEFNKARPETRREFSDRRERKLREAPLAEDRNFLDYVRSESSLAEQLDFGGAKLSGLDLSEANFAGIDFTEADFSRANLSYANLSNCDFNLANLSDATLNWANIWGADFYEANVIGVDFSNVKCLGHAKFAETFGLAEKQGELILHAIRETWYNSNAAWSALGLG
ncbi:MAG TPA: pentapeptide repeat-containing protein [Candidatus Andersenbacteria bacterium]|nr:pentapeptide repeat-containing protein [Candidatus Andersenbacteria bacterium]